jgi:hypothetical protein
MQAADKLAEQEFMVQHICNTAKTGSTIRVTHLFYR